MINLLPPNDRRQLAAARTNTLLRRYIFLLIVFIVIIVLEMTAFHAAISAENDRNNQIIAENAAKTSDYAPIKVSASQFQSDLATAKYILDKQVPYTSIFMKIATTLPADVVLDSLTINPDTFGTASTLNAHTTSFVGATKGKQKLQESGAFSDVSIQSTTQVENGNGGYNFSVIYNVIFSKDLLKS